MKLYISADIEGMPGVVSNAQASESGFDYASGRELMTTAVLAACQAAFECGVTNIVVSDSHGNASNLLYERMPANVELVRGWPRPLGMMQGIEAGPFVGAMLLGYHTKVGNAAGVQAHTLNGGAFHAVRFGQLALSEAHLSAAVAAEYGVPVLLVCGDDALAEEVRTDLGTQVETVITKWNHGMRSARMLPLATALDALRAGVVSALTKAHPPVLARSPLSFPAEVDIEFVHEINSECLCMLPGFKRLDAFTVRHVVDSASEAVRYFEFLSRLCR